MRGSLSFVGEEGVGRLRGSGGLEVGLGGRGGIFCICVEEI